MKTKVSVCLATFNEEQNIGECLSSVKEIASEIIVVDGSSADETAVIARSFGAKVIVTDNPPIFHINKQKALDLAKFDWILQLDADERVSKPLRDEIMKVVQMERQELEKYESTLPGKRLFKKNQDALENRDGKIGTDTGEYVAFFLPRLNYFLGKYLKYGGVYPDGAIRLVKKGKANFPCKNVHEIMTIEGRVGWLTSPLYHVDSPTFSRYLKRNKRYIKLLVKEMKECKTQKDLWRFLFYCVYKPLYWFLLTQIRHKGILDGWQGLVFSFFSALRFPRAYISYLRDESSN